MKLSFRFNPAIFSAIFISGLFGTFLFNHPRDVNDSTTSYVLDDECQCRNVSNVKTHASSTCGRLSTTRGPNQKVISFSFYLGNNHTLVADDAAMCNLNSSSNKYFDGIQRNVISVKELYPGYIMRLYHNIPSEFKCKITDKICDLFCQEDVPLDLCTVKNIEAFPGLEEKFGTVWRFAPMLDNFVDEWHSRDLDAVMLQREVDAVQEWARSNASIHIMRDHPYHGQAGVHHIFAGMFGMKQITTTQKLASTKEFTSIVNDELGTVWKRGNDQRALTKFVVPRASCDSLIHDSFHCQHKILIHGRITRPFPTERLMINGWKKDPNFVGNQGLEGMRIECPIECRPDDHKDWIYC